MSEQGKSLYQFGPFLMDADEGVLTHDGKPVQLTRKAFEVLLVLVRNQGRTVVKQVLLENVWPDTFIEGTTIAQNIFTLRKALGKTEDGRDYIENVPRRGYRLTARVEELPTDEAASQTGDGGTQVAGSQTALSLAVLPICNETEDPNAEYLSLGITESIISNLSQLPQLHVMASSSIFHFNCSSKIPQEIGRYLGVEVVMAGRLLKVSNRLIIRVELIDVERGWQLWGGQFSGKASCLLEIQEEISQEISMHLRLQLTKTEQALLTTYPTHNNKAYQFYMKGRYYWNKQSGEGYEKSIKFYQASIESDHNFALAYTGLADSYAMLDFYGLKPPHKIMPRARSAALEAVKIDESLAECHTSLACIKLLYEWDWRSAERGFRRALSLNPRYAHARHWYSRYLVAMGRFEESLVETEKALELDPFDPNSYLHFGSYYFYTRQYDQAVDKFRQALDLEPEFWPARLLLGETYALRGEYDEAIAVLDRPDVQKESPLALCFLGYIYALSHEESRARALLADLHEKGKGDYISPYGVALIHAGLGDQEQTFAWLDKACEEHNEWLGWLNVSPEFDSVRSDPRYDGVLTRVGIGA